MSACNKDSLQYEFKPKTSTYKDELSVPKSSVLLQLHKNLEQVTGESRKISSRLSEDLSPPAFVRRALCAGARTTHGGSDGMRNPRKWDLAWKKTKSTKAQSTQAPKHTKQHMTKNHKPIFVKGPASLECSTKTNDSTWYSSKESKSVMSPNSEDVQGTQNMSDPSVVRSWLAAPYHAKQLALLDKFEIELRLGRLATPSGAASATSSTGPRMDRRAVTVRTVELLKTMIGGTRWRTPAELVNLLRGLGRELHSAGGFREPAIGNVVRRIIAAVREEVMNGTGETENDGVAPSTNKPNVSRTKQHDRSLESMLWALPQHVKPGRATSGPRRSASQQHQRSESFGDVLETDSASASLDLPPQFYQNRPDLKQSIMEAILEITSDLEDLHKNINDQATNHIHAGEVILSYGQSRTIKMVRTHVPFVVPVSRSPSCS